MKGPVIIGGIGGSGTRVVVSILQNFGYFIGSDLNKALDNLTYSFLFRRPDWFTKNYTNREIINTGISILEKSINSENRFSITELTYLLNNTIWFAKNGLFKGQKGKTKWAISRLLHILLKKQKDLSSYERWAWKEPNSHLLVKELNDYFPQIKYIHTVRHGLDMAYSTNQNQVINWGPMFGVNPPKKEKEIPYASFRYWVEVNRGIVSLREELGSKKVYILNFDELCLNPKSEINKLINFLGIEVNSSKLEEAIGLPVIPKSKGRYKSHDITGFSDKDIDFLHSLGYSS